MLGYTNKLWSFLWRGITCFLLSWHIFIPGWKNKMRWFSLISKVRKSPRTIFLITEYTERSGIWVNRLEAENGAILQPLWIFLVNVNTTTTADFKVLKVWQQACKIPKNSTINHLVVVWASSRTPMTESYGYQLTCLRHYRTSNSRASVLCIVILILTLHDFLS